MDAGMPLQKRRKRIVMALTGLALLAALLLVANTIVPFRVVKAMLMSKDAFTNCTGDARIKCEPGSEPLAKVLAAHLDGAVVTIERAQYGRFARPILIYTYATIDSFTAHTGYAHPEGTAFDNGVHISPRTSPAIAGAVLTHEMSHLHLIHAVGMWKLAGMPHWFVEGLATHVANGDGPEGNQEAAAVFAMASGKCIVPKVAHSRWAPTDRIPANMKLSMFYRQGAMFVAYLEAANPPAFKQLLAGLGRKQSFGDAISGAYGVPSEQLWEKFLHQTRTEFNASSVPQLGPLCGSAEG